MARILGGFVSMLLSLFAAGISVCGAPFEPDPNAVQRFGKGYKHPQQGWLVVHIEGNPYERGEQHGRLLAAEIDSYIRCLAASFGSQLRPDSWQKMKRLTDELMLPHYPPEILEEMRGIAEGASAAGAAIDGKPLDVTDIAVINAANEIDLLSDAVEATPGGLEGLQASSTIDAVVRAFEPARETSAARPVRRPRPSRCSAFVANGPATHDGKIVFGHITMYDLYQANFYNVWLEVVPTEGFRFAMQTTPGGTHSGMDFTMNSAGLLLSETTIQQTAFDPAGRPLAVRIREASQYADSIERAAEILSKDGNGLVSTEWILGDVHKNEIALLTLGLRKQVLRRGSRNEWLEGAEGFYWSCNNTKDAEVRLETVPGLDSRPSHAAVFEPTKRDALWLALYRSHRGRIDEDFARKALSTPALVSAFSVDAMFTTGELAARLKAWGAFGPPVGGVRYPSAAETVRFPEIQPLLPNPWTLLEPVPPRKGAPSSKPVDLVDPEEPLAEAEAVREREDEPDDWEPAWTGTLLPATEADAWLAAAFAHYEKIVALEHGIGAAERERLGVELNYHRSVYGISCLRSGDLPLGRLRPRLGEGDWYRIASGKGVLLFHQLREWLGVDAFDSAAAEFGKAHAGKPVSAADLRNFLERRTRRDLSGFFKEWLEGTGLPRVELSKAKISRAKESPREQSWEIELGVKRVGSCNAPVVVPVTIEFEEGERTVSLSLEGAESSNRVKLPHKPHRAVLDKYGTAGLANGHPFTVLSFEGELEDTWIVYGTLGDALVNAESARILRGALVRREHNISVLVKADVELNEEDLKGRHLVLVGRPETHRLVKKWEQRLPVKFGKQSLEVAEDLYAHPATAVILAERNPADERYSLVIIAGVSGQGTIRAAPLFEVEGLPVAQTVVLPYQRSVLPLTLPSKAQVRHFK